MLPTIKSSPAAPPIPSLDITVAKVPRGAEHHQRPTVEIIHKVLENLGYKGLWSVAFIKQTTKKSNIKFQLIRHEGHSVKVRTKPSDNSSVWELLITPPRFPVYDTKEVSERFKDIHPTRLTDMKASIPEPRTVVEKEHVAKVELDEVEKEIQQRKDSYRVELAQVVGTVLDNPPPGMPPSIVAEGKRIVEDVQMEAALKKAGTERAAKLTSAKEFLSEFVKGKPTAKSIIIAAATKQGIDPALLERAANEIGVIKSPANTPEAWHLKQPEPPAKTYPSVKDFLLDILSKGSVQQKAVIAAGEAAGLSKYAIDQARIALGITSEHRGFGPNGASYWSLPAKQPESSLESSLDLRLDPNKVGKIPGNGHVLSRGLIAVCEMVKIPHKVIALKKVGISVTARLDLKNFCARHHHYNSVPTVFRVLIADMVKNGWLERIDVNANHTSTIAVTDQGWSVYKNMDLELLDEEDVGISEADFEDTPAVVPAKAPNATPTAFSDTDRAKLQAQQAKLQAYQEALLATLAEHDKVKLEITNYDELIAEAQREVGVHETAIKNSDAEIASLREQLKAAEQRKTQAIDNRIDSLGDVEKLRNAQNTENQKLVAITQKLQEMSKVYG